MKQDFEHQYINATRFIQASKVLLERRDKKKQAAYMYARILLETVLKSSLLHESSIEVTKPKISATADHCPTEEMSEM
jgi:hypothetical protein